MVHLAEFSPYQTDNLMLLMGTNPLPNYVAVRLLGRLGGADGPATRLHLVVTDEIICAKMHRYLMESLGGNSGDEGQYLHVKPTHPEDIYAKVSDRVTATPGTWGLHYTGGKKSMAVHAYRAVEDALRNRSPGVFSYLDADTLEMVIDPTEGRPDRRLLAHLKAQVGLAQLLELHGRPLSPKKMPETEPFQAETCRQLVRFCQDEIWRKRWVQSVRRLNKGTDRIPEFVPVIGGRTLAQVGDEGAREVSYVSEWFKGKWLEHYVLDTIVRLGEDVGVHDVGRSFEPKGLTRFEVDVAAMQGYRLFAISVTTSRTDDVNQKKLFEARIRAQQMGGDEARAALVTFCDSARALVLERKVQEIWGRHSRVRVFGLQDLPQLPDRFRQWFKEGT